MNKKLSNIFKGDKVIWMVFFFLCIISVVEVFSASSELTYKGGNYWAPMLKHASLLFAGVAGMIIVLNIPCKYFRILTLPLLGLSIATLLLVIILGHSTNGAQRWLSVGGLQFQPSELAKGALVLATAQILSAMQTPNGTSDTGFKYIIIVCLCIIPFIATENLSTAVLISVVIFLMMFVGRVRLKYLGRIASIAILAATIAVSAIMLLGGEEQSAEQKNKQFTETIQKQDEQKEKDESVSEKIFHRAATWKNRIQEFIVGFDYPPEQVDLDGDAQRAHANIAIASSNIIGRGPGNSVERDFLSQAFSDFIYAIIIEELGIFGAIVVALLYIILLFRTRYIASRCENCFPAFLAMGLALLLVMQAVMNMWVAVGLAPVTGQPLPLLSKGGTSTIINCVYIGVILSISRTAKRRETPATASAKIVSIADKAPAPPKD